MCGLGLVLYALSVSSPALVGMAYHSRLTTVTLQAGGESTLGKLPRYKTYLRPIHESSYPSTYSQFSKMDTSIKKPWIETPLIESATLSKQAGW